MKQEYGQDNIVSAWVHKDEKSFQKAQAFWYNLLDQCFWSFSLKIADRRYI